jgi:hypothetical protein
LAQLAEHFHLSPQAVACLTDRQVRNILFHKRDKNGVLVAPVVLPPSPKEKRQAEKLPESMEEEIRSIEALRSWVSEENYKEMLRTIEERWRTGQRDGRS